MSERVIGQEVLFKKAAQKDGSERGPRMTPYQARATHPALTAFVGASAGTGKTHVLTARVLRLMLTGTPPENILCVTFTKAAAAEMKNRIFKELGRWAIMEDAELAGEIMRRTEETADADMLDRARSLFARVLDIAGGLKVTTFHSFCQSLLARFPLEAGLAPGFEGVEEGEARGVMQQARDMMLAKTRTLSGAKLKEALAQIVVKVTENTFDDVIERLNFSISALNAALKYFGSETNLFAALDRALGVKEGETLENCCVDALALTPSRLAGLQALASGMAAGSAVEAKKAAVIQDFLTQKDRESAACRLAFYAPFKAIFLTQKGTPQKIVANKDTIKADPGLLDIIEAEQVRFIRAEEKQQQLEAAKGTKALLTLGLAQLKAYEGLKNTRGLVDFDDMIERTRHLLQDPGQALWVLFKLDSGIDHILVDEAQDTNREQWQILEALAAEFFAGDSARDVRRTLFAVGDVKQSIYSFQKADPAHFMAAKDRLFARAEQAEMPAETVPLSLSFRSGRAVLALVDAVFRPSGRAHVGLGGETVQHDFQRKGTEGLVELWPLERPSEQRESEEGFWRPPVQAEKASSGEEKCARRIADHIADTLAHRDLLAPKGRAVTAGDILVLVRKRGTFVDKLSRALKARGVGVAGRDRMKLLDELPVKDMLVLAEAVLQPYDDLTLATLLKSPFLNVSEDALFDLAYGRSASLMEALREKAAAALCAGKNEDGSAVSWPVVLQQLEDWMRRADRLGPFDFFSRLLDEEGMRRQMALRLGADIHDPLDEFLAEALKFEQTRPASLRGFLSAVKASPATLKRDFEENVPLVRIMTVHSAKGLQAPIVYLADKLTLPRTSKEATILPLALEGGKPPLMVWSAAAPLLPLVVREKEKLKARVMEEYRRLLYVALTRAEDRLFVAGWAETGQDEEEETSASAASKVSKEPKPGEETWYDLITDGFDALDGTAPDKDGIRRFYVAQTAPVLKAENARESKAQTAFPAWLEAPMPQEQIPARPLAPSRPDPEEPPAISPLMRTKDGFLRGQLIHRLMEILPDAPSEKRPAMMQALLADPAYGLPLADQKFISRQLTHIVSDGAFSALFGPLSRAEVPVAGTIGQRQIAGQVDRLVVLADRVMIVDYKTNRPPPSDPALVEKAYLVQMGLYRRAFQMLYPDRRIETFILWTHTADLMALDGDFLEKILKEKGF